MSIKMKGLVKSIKLLSQIFVYKKHEMEIGFPTDVQHVAHIGWDGQNTNNPSWMNELKTSSDFSTGSFADSRDTASWASQDFDQPKDIPSFGMFSDATCPPDIPKAPKKIKKKKKTRPPTSPASTTSARSSRSSKSRTSFATAFEDFDQERKDYRLT